MDITHKRPQKTVKSKKKTDKNKKVPEAGKSLVGSKKLE
jgi:hypothetical protein